MTMTKMKQIEKLSRDTLSMATDLFTTEDTYRSPMGGDYHFDSRWRAFSHIQL